MGIAAVETLPRERTSGLDWSAEGRRAAGRRTTDHSDGTRTRFLDARTVSACTPSGWGISGRTGFRSSQFRTRGNLSGSGRRADRQPRQMPEATARLQTGMIARVSDQSRTTSGAGRLRPSLRLPPHNGGGRRKITPQLYATVLCGVQCFSPASAGWPPRPLIPGVFSAGAFHPATPSRRHPGRHTPAFDFHSRLRERLNDRAAFGAAQLGF